MSTQVRGGPRWPRSPPPRACRSPPSPRCSTAAPTSPPRPGRGCRTCSRKHDYVGRRGGAGRAPADRRAGVRRRAQRVRHRDRAGRAGRGGRARVAVVVSVAVRGRRGAVGPPVAWARELVATGREAVIGVVNALTAGDVTALARGRAAARGHRPARPAARPGHQRRARPTSPAAWPRPSTCSSLGHRRDRLRRRLARPRPATRPACTASAPRWRRRALPVPDGYVRDGLLPLPGRRRRGDRAASTCPRRPRPCSPPATRSRPG